jgi:phosphatidylglycerophosphate synthase
VVVSLLSLDERFAAMPQFLLSRDVVLWSAVAVTIYSGVEYTYRAYRMLRA